jgi:hypothetical protein
MALTDRDMTVTVTVGEQKFSPIQFNVFTVGPFTATVVVREGEDVQEVMTKVRESLLDYAREEYKVSLERYTKALRYNDNYLRKSGGEK